MDALRANYGDGDKDEKVIVPSDSSALPPPASLDGGTSGGDVDAVASAAAEARLVVSETKSGGDHAVGSKEELEAMVSEQNSALKVMENIRGDGSIPEDTPNQRPDTDGVDEVGGGEGEDEPHQKKQKQLSDFPEIGKSAVDVTEVPSSADAVASQSHGGKPPTGKTGKKSKKKSKDVWVSSSRKGKKKTKHASNNNLKSKNAIEGDASITQKLVLAPVSRYPDKYDDSPEMKICLSKIYKAEKVDLSQDRLEACSTKGFRMVRATRGVTSGAWYFEIKVDYLGETGHTRLGWSTEKADLQAPVGYDGHSYGYRDIDGSKVHKAWRQKYGDEGYKEGDVIGFYINLPDGDSYAPSRRRVVWHKGQRYVSAPDPEDVPKVVPGSEISYFKNGVCQGVAFTDLNGGRYYPAASMYTLPNELPCVVKFNFGPTFKCFPEHFGERLVPKPMIEVPYQSYDSTFENGNLRNITRMPPMLRVIKEENKKFLKDAEMVG